MKPLTDSMHKALMDAEDTLFGDVKLGGGFGRSVPGMRKRGLVYGDSPHVYLTQYGREMKDKAHTA